MQLFLSAAGSQCLEKNLEPWAFGADLESRKASLIDASHGHFVRIPKPLRLAGTGSNDKELLFFLLLGLTELRNHFACLSSR